MSPRVGPWFRPWVGSGLVPGVCLSVGSGVGPHGGPKIGSRMGPRGGLWLSFREDPVVGHEVCLQLGSIMYFGLLCPACYG